MIELESVRMRSPEDTNIIVGQTHFIKTAEDMYEAVVNTVPQAKFGLAFNESSGPCLTRSEGNDDELRNALLPTLRLWARDMYSFSSSVTRIP
jgi:adenosine/AMP kinase